MKLSASDLHVHFQPSACELRTYLQHVGETPAAPGPFEEVIRRLGQQHENTHLAGFGTVTNLAGIDLGTREQLTLEAIARKDEVIYQPAFRVATKLAGVECDVVGQPDFLLLEGTSYVIRDAKMARRITEEDHPQIIRQLQLYGWLFTASCSRAPTRLEVCNGAGQIVTIEDDGGISALECLTEIVRIRSSGTEPYSPVGWTKCGACPYASRCWSKAEKSNDVALLFGVDQGLAKQLHQVGQHDIQALLCNFDEERLAEFQRPWGTKMQRVGKKASSILQMADAVANKRQIVISPPEIPDRPNYVMFDLEGLPPQLDELEKIYLWGLQVFGEKPGPYLASVCHSGMDGDKQAWLAFLDQVEQLFTIYGDIPFVHWHHYERAKLDLYVQRYGDVRDIARRIRQNLLDLLPITQRSVVLPIPSYSLKVVEKYVGFHRTQTEYGGDWAMAKYIEATESNDDVLRQEVFKDILIYNREDLEATWAVFQWLRAL